MASSATCICMTQKGTRCTRKAAAGCGKYCKQHFDMVSSAQEEEPTKVPKVPVQPKVPKAPKVETDDEEDDFFCACVTKKGTRCTRKAAAGHNYCTQHLNMKVDEKSDDVVDLDEMAQALYGHVIDMPTNVLINLCKSRCVDDQEFKKALCKMCMMLMLA